MQAERRHKQVLPVVFAAKITEVEPYDWTSIFVHAMRLENTCGVCHFLCDIHGGSGARRRRRVIEQATACGQGGVGAHLFRNSTFTAQVIAPCEQRRRDGSKAYSKPCMRQQYARMHPHELQNVWGAVRARGWDRLHSSCVERLCRGRGGGGGGGGGGC